MRHNRDDTAKHNHGLGTMVSSGGRETADMSLKGLVCLSSVQGREVSQVNLEELARLGLATYQIVPRVKRHTVNR